MTFTELVMSRGLALDQILGKLGISAGNLALLDAGWVILEGIGPLERLQQRLGNPIVPLPELQRTYAAAQERRDPTTRPRDLAEAENLANAAWREHRGDPIAYLKARHIPVSPNADFALAQQIANTHLGGGRGRFVISYPGDRGVDAFVVLGYRLKSL